MTTASAEGEAIRYSAYQYSPASLVYTDEQWAGKMLADVKRLVDEYMDMDQASATVRKGWEALCKEKGP
eukprot:280471-Alexandrium_andersonii.AAC.1